MDRETKPGIKGGRIQKVPEKASMSENLIKTVASPK